MNAPEVRPDLNPAPHWVDVNQRLLVAAFARLRQRLGQTGDENGIANTKSSTAPADEHQQAPALVQLGTVFGLSDFELGVLLLAAGRDMDGSLAQRLPQLNFGVALTVLDGAHWSALSPMSPLRAWRLIELDGQSPTQAPIRIDERILHYLAGVNHLDARLAPLLRVADAPRLLAPSHVAVADMLSRRAENVASPVVLNLHGNDAEARLDVAAHLAQRGQLVLLLLDPSQWPTTPDGLDLLATLLQRELALMPAALMIEWSDDSAAAVSSLIGLVRRLDGLILVGSREPLACGQLQVSARGCVNLPSAPEQAALWRQALAEPAAARAGWIDEVAAIASQFRFSAAAIARHAPALAALDSGSLWHECRQLARAGLDGLAQRIDTDADWADLVLPPAQLEQLHRLVAQVRQRQQVYTRWGLGPSGSRGLGISALFHGDSGVGKTLACEVLANELDLDLYRIDLACLVSKYIGETEKNLGRVFDVAEASGAVLLFDEADALFGKRSEVRDSHDRYANLEVSYLLQRMESYQGLAVLTTNLRGALDPAFVRRLRFVVHFPFPDQVQREAMWRGAFPENLPVAELDLARLARVQASGAQIRNMVINAAFLSAQDGRLLAMTHLAQAAQMEASKHERGQGDALARGLS